MPTPKETNPGNLPQVACEDIRHLQKSPARVIDFYEQVMAQQFNRLSSQNPHKPEGKTRLYYYEFLRTAAQQAALDAREAVYRMYGDFGVSVVKNWDAELGY